jgi:hypothetical protein
MVTREDLAPDIGGFLDNVPGEIIKATFELASGKYADQIMMGGGNAKLPVMLTISVESPDLEKTASQSYSVGGSDVWDIVGDGKSIVNIKAPEKRSFRKGSMAWRLVESMMEAAGEGDIDKGQAYFIGRGHYMTDAAFFTGLNWQWEVKEIKIEIGSGANKKEIISRPPLPAKLLGATEAAATGKTATKTAAAPVAGAEGLDKLVIDNASGKSEKEVKTFAVHNPEIKKNDAYMKSIVSGKKLRELEASGTLVKHPDTGLYI